ncbi:unnamed protein product [Merluccius merluccius]
MPQNATVIVRYGPYESCGLVEHRTFRLQGLQCALGARGHRCVLERSSERDSVELEVNGERVFTCRVTHLEFGEAWDTSRPIILHQYYAMAN